MVPADQEFLYQETPRVYGDCVRASIASVLELPISEVPHFLHLAKGEVYENYCLIEDFLLAKGCEVLWQVNIEDHLVVGRNVYHLISGQSPRDPTIGHMVVGLNGAICHDPHPS